jgi:hypothetical protein
MKILNKLFAQSRVIDDLFKTDLTDKSADRTACATQIEKLIQQLNGLSTQSLATAEKNLADAQLKLEIARKAYADESIAIEHKRRQLTKAIGAEEQKLKALTPLIVQQAFDNLNEKIESSSILTPVKASRLNAMFEDLRGLVRVVDDKVLLKRLADIEKNIAAVFS